MLGNRNLLFNTLFFDNTIHLPTKKNKEAGYKVLLKVIAVAQCNTTYCAPNSKSMADVSFTATSAWTNQTRHCSTIANVTLRAMVST
jgi:hypothetical protein